MSLSIITTQIIPAPNAPNSQEMRLVFPNAHRINRGGYVVKELAEACRANDVTDLIVLHEHRGVPGSSNVAVPFLSSSLTSRLCQTR
jgi:U3 small nucleolar ribonucleoprotein protein IMP4